MYQVGGNQGMAYTGQEGKGKAFILPEDDDAMLAWQNLLKNQEQQVAAKDKAKTDKEVKAKKTKDKLTQAVPEWWIAHDTEMQKVTDEVMGLGAELMNSGIEDPSQGTDPGSILFQKEMARLDQMGKLSTQYRDIYEKDRPVILADEDDNYTKESKDAVLNFYEEGTLQERLVNGDLPPRLMVKEPEFKRAAFYKDLSAAVANENPEPELEDYKNIIGMAMNDPSAKGFQETLFTDVTNMKTNNPDAYARLEAEAKANGMAPMEMLGVKQLESYFDTEPVNIAETIKDFIPELKTTKYSYEDVENVTTYGETRTVDPDKLKTAAEAYLDFNPKAFTQLIQGGLAKDRATAVEYISKLMKAQKPEYTESGVKRLKGAGDYEGTGYGKDDIIQAADEWYKYLTGDGEDISAAEKFKRQKKAAEFLHGVKGEGGVGTYTWGRQLRSGATFGIAGETGEVYGTEDDYNPNQIIFGVAIPEDVEIETGNGKIKTKRIKEGKQQWQFNDPSGENFGSFDAMLPYFVQGVKKQGRLFEPDLERGPDETEGGRKSTEKEILQKKKNEKVIQENKGVLKSPNTPKTTTTTTTGTGGVKFNASNK